MSKIRLLEEARRNGGGSMLGDLLWLRRLTGMKGRVSAGILALGLLASFAEALGVTVVVLFLFVMIGDSAQVPLTTGALGGFYRRIIELVGDSGTALGGLIFALIALKASVGMAYAQAGAVVANRISETVRNAVHAQYLAVSYEFIRRHDDSELASILANESATVARAHAWMLRIGVNIGAILVFGALVLLACWQLAVLAAIGWLALFGLQRWLTQSVRRLGEASIAANSDLTQRMLNALSGARTIRAFGQARMEQERFAAVSAEVRRTALRTARLYRLLNLLNEVGSMAVLCGIIAAAVPLGVPTAAMLTGLALLHRLQPHVQEMFSNFADLAGAAPSLHVLRHLLDPAGKTFPAEGHRPFPGSFEEIRLEGLRYRHAGATEPSLASVSFTIRRNERLALAGPSGAGKSTIINLLLRLYEPDAGTITVDGVPLAELERQGWLTRLGVAGQDVELIEGTINENILGTIIESVPPVLPKELGLTMADIRAAAQVAGVLEFAERLPDGLDTWIGDRGANLSGGQRQRLGIARAILRRPALLILDEATSALDVEAEREILSRVLEWMAGRTVVVISHRPGGVDWADRTVRIANGVAMEDNANPVQRAPGHQPLSRGGPAAR